MSFTFMLRHPAVILLFCVSACNSVPKATETTHANISIIPQPVSITTIPLHFLLRPSTEIFSTDVKSDSVAHYVKEFLKAPTGFELDIVDKEKERDQIQLILVESLDQINNHREGYVLYVNSKTIVIRATTTDGLFYGVQTLRQLLPPAIACDTTASMEWIVPGVTIVDYPRFDWRGLHLDVSRHFFDKAEVKRYIDQLSQYKFNRFQWHLTDDQGWRIEIKRLPLLTSVGAWRVPRTGIWWEHKPPQPGEAKTYGGFYTQEDIKEVVAYARERHVDVVPEIDVPGHSMAALAAYPELSSTGGTFDVNPGSKFYTQIDNALCPCEETTYAFLEKVLEEVITLFPYEYVHIGGDECYKGFWEQNSACKTLMAQAHMKSTLELQSYLIKRVEKMLHARGKRLIGWDEILEGGLAPDATVMSWRGMDGGIAAAKQGHAVIMTPVQHCYLDFYQGDPESEPPTYAMLRLKDAYAFEPVPADVDPKRILGGQGNLWTEFVPTYRHAEYMAWPRSFALAEALWTPPQNRQWQNFEYRVEQHFARLDSAGVNYSRSVFDPAFVLTKDDTGKSVVTLETEITNITLHYTLDNTFPDAHSPAYTSPITIPEGAVALLVRSYRGSKPMGKMIRMTTQEIRERLARKKLGY